MLCVSGSNVMYEWYYYIFEMGAGQQQPCEIWLSIERNPQYMEKELFDFTKERSLLTTTKVTFPSYLHHYEKTNEIQYSLLQDMHNELFTLDFNHPFTHQFILRRGQRKGRGSIWKNLKESELYEMEEGDRIKVGRVELYLKEVGYINAKRSLKYARQDYEDETPQKSQQLLNPDAPLKNSGFFNQYQMSRMKESDVYSMKRSDYIMAQSSASHRSNGHHEKSCRICFDSKSSGWNPLFNVCLCSGSVKYVHYECLRSWFRSKTIRFETPHCVYYNYEPLQCQICKYAISNEVMYQGKKYSLFQYEKIHPPYAKFEHYSDNKVFQILIRLEESLNIMIGRGPENDLNLNDSTISRSHCSLFYSSQKLFLKGHPSKYGTFIQLNKNIELRADEPLELIISNHLIRLTRKDDYGDFIRGGCCSANAKSMIIVQ